MRCGLLNLTKIIYRYNCVTYQKPRQTKFSWRKLQFHTFRIIGDRQVPHWWRSSTICPHTSKSTVKSSVEWCARIVECGLCYTVAPSYNHFRYEKMKSRSYYPTYFPTNTKLTMSPSSAVTVEGVKKSPWFPTSTCGALGLVFVEVLRSFLPSSQLSHSVRSKGQ